MISILHYATIVHSPSGGEVRFARRQILGMRIHRDVTNRESDETASSLVVAVFGAPFPFSLFLGNADISCRPYHTIPAERLPPSLSNTRCPGLDTRARAPGRRRAHRPSRQTPTDVNGRLDFKSMAVGREHTVCVLASVRPSKPSRCRHVHDDGASGGRIFFNRHPRQRVTTTTPESPHARTTRFGYDGLWCFASLCHTTHVCKVSATCRDLWVLHYSQRRRVVLDHSDMSAVYRRLLAP